MKGRDLLGDCAFILGALATGLVPLLVFVVLSYHQTIRRADDRLAEVVGLAVALVEDAIARAETELIRFAQVSDMRLNATSRRMDGAMSRTGGVASRQDGGIGRFELGSASGRPPRSSTRTAGGRLNVWRMNG